MMISQKLVRVSNKLLQPIRLGYDACVENSGYSRSIRLKSVHLIKNRLSLKMFFKLVTFSKHANLGFSIILTRLARLSAILKSN